MEIIITPEAEKQYRRLPKSEQKKIKRKLLVLERNPLAGKKLSGSLAETRSLKVWPHRILYYIDRNKSTIFVATITHRQGVYK